MLPLYWFQFKAILLMFYTYWNLCSNKYSFISPPSSCLVLLRCFHTRTPSAACGATLPKQTGKHSCLLILSKPVISDTVQTLPDFPGKYTMYTNWHTCILAHTCDVMVSFPQVSVCSSCAEWLHALVGWYFIPLFLSQSISLTHTGITSLPAPLLTLSLIMHFILPTFSRLFP